MKRLFAVVLTAIIGLSCLGCQSDEQDAAESITVYLWSTTLLTDYAPYVESQLPGVEIEWVIGANDLDFYKQLQEAGELPDVITNRRFSLNDARELQPYLMDLSTTEVAAAFYTTYLEAYRNADGSVNWLPACGEIDGFLANKTLFDRYGIALPTDYASFVAVCDAFEEHGIRGFASDFLYDYTSMEMLQGLSIPELTSLEGRVWRAAYEQGTTTSLDDEIWPVAFERMERFIDDTGLTVEDAERGYVKVMNDFKAEKIAIVRGTGGDLASLERDGVEEVVFLPYFAEDAANSWVLTYPSFQVALNGALEQDEAKKALALEVLEVMLSDPAQDIIASNCAVTYSRDVEFEPSDDLESVLPYIERNHLYIRLASNDFFAASKAAVTKMLAGECDAAAAYDVMNELLSAPDVEAEPVFTSEVSAPFAFSAEGGNPAQSVVANTLREAVGADLLFSPFTLACRSLDAGAWTQKELEYVIASNTPNLYMADLTGAEIRQIVQASIENAEFDIRVINRYSLPVASGFEMQVRETEGGFVLEGLTVGGQPLDDAATYRFAYANSVTAARHDLAIAFGDEAAVERFEPEQTTARVIWTNVLLGGSQPAAPSAYLTLS